MNAFNRAAQLPHDWTIKTWPRDVYPYDGLKARHLLRINQAKLLAAAR